MAQSFSGENTNSPAAAPASSFGSASTPSAPSASPAGAGTASASAPSAAQQSANNRNSIVLIEFPITIQNVLVPVSGQPYIVPDGAFVEIAPDRGNVGDVFYSLTGPDAALTGPRTRLVKTDNPITVVAQILSQIWCSGAAGDKVIVRVRRNQ